MIKNKTTIEHITGNKVFQFVCDVDASIDLVKEALQKFLQFACQIEEHAKALQEKADKEKAEKEQVQPDLDIKPE